jgi:outer membrane lipoprotein-sorting protein
MERSFSLDKLGAYSGRADRELGTKVIHGKRTRGFAINVKKINPDCRAAGLFEIWLDSETNLPVFLRYEIKAEDLSVITEQCDIQWNVELDPKLFDPKPPAGYRDVTPKPTARGK